MLKLEKTAKASEILAKSAVGKIEGADEAFMMELLSCHPHSVEKIGCGVERIEIRTSGNWKQKQFWIVRKDGSAIDFSYRKCISGEGTDWGKFCKAARNSVMEQILEAREAYFGDRHEMTCEVLGTPLTRTSCHVDHHPIAFEKIAKDFVKEFGVDLKSVKYESRGDVLSFADDTGEKFAEYHRKFAKLRVISKEANLAKEYERRKNKD